MPSNPRRVAVRWRVCSSSSAASNSSSILISCILIYLRLRLGVRVRVRVGVETTIFFMLAQQITRLHFQDRGQSYSSGEWRGAREVAPAKEAREVCGGRRGRRAVARVAAQWASAGWGGRGSENRAGKPLPNPVLMLVLKPAPLLAIPAANPAPRPKIELCRRTDRHSAFSDCNHRQDRNHRQGRSASHPSPPRCSHRQIRPRLYR